MKPKSQHTTPLLVANGQVHHLSGMLLGSNGGGISGGGFDESWLQKLIHEHPEVLPIQQIEPGKTDVVSVCRELPVPSK